MKIIMAFLKAFSITIIIGIFGLFIFVGCASKPDVIVMDSNTYYFAEGVENFYVVNLETGEKVKIK